MAHNPDKVSPRNPPNHPNVPNGGVAYTTPHHRSPANIRPTLRGSRPKPALEKIDRTACRARSNAAGVPQHGTTSAYRNFDCRCPDALRASRRDRKLRQHGIKSPCLVDATASARRLQALACMGWQLSELAKHLDAHKSRVGLLRQKDSPLVFRETDAVIRNLYHNLSGKSGGDLRTRNWAAKSGWAPPIAWDEDTIGDPNAKPQHQAQDQGIESDNWDIDLQLLLSGRYTVPTKFGSRIALVRYQKLTTEAVSILTNRGLDAYQIAALLKTTPRNVTRHRAIIRQRRAPIRSGSQGINNATVVTTPSTGTPREARVA